MSQRRILVASDEEITALSIQRKLEEMGYHPKIASSGEEAISEALDKHRYTKQLRVAADISQQISAILEPERLLSVTVSLLQERFELEHVHVYLLDGGRVVMQAGSGQVGRQLGERNHTIHFDDEQSLVAQVARTKQALLAGETHSQIAVPLMVAGQLLGVLHVQEKQGHRFMPADLDVFNMLAGNLATALAYARLYQTRQQAEQALRQSELKFRSIVQSANDAIILADTTGNIIGWNTGAQAIFGYQEEELLGQPLQRIMPPRYRAAHEHGFNRLQATGIPHLIGQTVEIHGLRKDGTEFPLELALTTWSSEAGTFYSGIIRDITERKRAEEERQRLFEQVQRNLEETQRTAEHLRELDRLKSEFLASMSHELRTPLNSIIGYAEIILMGLNGPLSQEMTEDMEAIRHSGQHLLHIINDILDLAKIEAGHMTLAYEKVEFSGLLDQIRVRHLALLHDKPVELLIEMDANVPSIEADRIRVNQILTNLVSNAIKFTEKGIVRLHATYNDGWVQIAVQDSGIGIKKSDLATIFQQFRQVDGSNSRRAGGTGLGLTITNHLVQLHGGTITVESELDKGSTFFVRLPIKRPPEAGNSEQ